MTLYYGTILGLPDITDVRTNPGINTAGIYIGLPVIDKFRTKATTSVVKIGVSIELFEINMFKCNISGKSLVTGTWVAKSLNRWFL